MNICLLNKLSNCISLGDGEIPDNGNISIPDYVTSEQFFNGVNKRRIDLTRASIKAVFMAARPRHAHTSQTCHFLHK